MKIFKWSMIILLLVSVAGCYPNVKSDKSVITEPDGLISSFDEGDYIDNLTRDINIVYSNTSERYFVSTGDGLFDAFYTKKILGNYYLIEGIKEKRKPVNIYLIKLEQNKIFIYQFNIPNESFTELQSKFDVGIIFDKDEIFIEGESYNIFEFTKYCIKNRYIKSDFYLTKKVSNL